MPAPKTPKGAKSDKEWREAIRLAVHEVRGDGSGKKVKALRLLSKRLVEAALEGDMTAMKEIGDRLDGKPAQTLGTDPDRPLKLIVEILD